MTIRPCILTVSLAASLALTPAAQSQVVLTDGSTAGGAVASSDYSAATLRVMRFHYQALVHYYRVHPGSSIGPGMPGTAAKG